MPRLTSIYTRKGDDGTTALGSKTRVAQLAETQVHNQQRFKGFNLLAQHDAALFRSLLSGAFVISGFANKDLRRILPDLNTGQVTRLLKRLRVHGLIKKVARCHKLDARWVYLTISSFKEELMRVGYARVSTKDQSLDLQGRVFSMILIGLCNPSRLETDGLLRAARLGPTVGVTARFGRLFLRQLGFRIQSGFRFHSFTSLPLSR